MPSRQIIDFFTKSQKKKIELVDRPGEALICKGSHSVFAPSGRWELSGETWEAVGPDNLQLGSLGFGPDKVGPVRNLVVEWGLLLFSFLNQTQGVCSGSWKGLKGGGSEGWLGP